MDSLSQWSPAPANPPTTALGNGQDVQVAPDQRRIISAPSDVDWEEFKPVIQFLYIDENRTLDEVVEQMHATHGFKAT